MKTIIFGLSAAGILIFVIIAFLAIEGRTDREHELDTALRDSMQQVLEERELKNGKIVYDDQALEQALKDRVIKQITGNDDTSEGAVSVKDDDQLKIEVDVAAADCEKGMLSAVAREWYTHPNGKKGYCQAQATAILESEAEKDTCTVIYKLPWQASRDLNLPYIAGEDSTYARYVIEAGKEEKQPADPPDIDYGINAGKRFTGWEKISADTRTDTSGGRWAGRVNTDAVYLAVYE